MNIKLALMVGTLGLSIATYAEPAAPGAVPPPPAPGPHGALTAPGPHDDMRPEHPPGHEDKMMKDHPLTDAQIVQIVETTNEGEIAAARIEKNHGKNEDAKSFASMMIEQHMQNNKDLKTLAKKLSMHPEKTPKSDKIHKDARLTGERFDKMKGADLDRAYATKQVKAHQDVLDELDTVLIPQAKNEELKALLTSTRATVAQHLEHAQAVEKTVNGSPETSKQ